MAHWAKINDNGIVENVIVTSNDDVDEGESWIAENLDGIWLKTSYNTRKGRHLLGGEPFRKNFAQPGFIYTAELDAFIPPKLNGEEDFILNPELGIWVPPVSVPEDADFVTMYGPDFTDIPDEAKVYFWIPAQSSWGMLPNTLKPEGEYYWNPIAKEWQLPDVEKPGENYSWNVFTNEWVEVPALPEAPTEAEPTNA